MSSFRHTYEGLEDNHKLKVELSMRDLAERVDELNYGVHRFLSHLVDVRREKLMERIKEYVARGDYDVAAYASTRGDPLMEAIEKLLDEGCW